MLKLFYDWAARAHAVVSPVVIRRAFVRGVGPVEKIAAAPPAIRDRDVKWFDPGERRTARTIPELKVRALLADLLVHEGRPVSADRLVDDLWGDDAARPTRRPRCRSGSPSCAGRWARRAGWRDLVASRATWLRAATGRTRWTRAGSPSLAERAAGGRPTRGRGPALLAEALALWRGPAFADFADEEFARAAIARLEEQRLPPWRSTPRPGWSWASTPCSPASWPSWWPGTRCGSGCGPCTCGRCTGPGGRARRWTATPSCASGSAEELGLDPGPELAALHQAILAPGPADARRRRHGPPPTCPLRSPS